MKKLLLTTFAVLALGAGCANSQLPEKPVQLKLEQADNETKPTESMEKVLVQATSTPLEQDKSESKPVVTQPTKPTKARIRDSQLTMGSWSVVNSSVGFASIEFYANGQYSSFLHDRPFGDGRWTLENNTLDLVSNSDEAFFTDLWLEGDILTMKMGTEKNIWKHNK